jgi:hypothetical protein
MKNIFDENDLSNTKFMKSNDFKSITNQKLPFKTIIKIFLIKLYKKLFKK